MINFHFIPGLLLCMRLSSYSCTCFIVLLYEHTNILGMGCLSRERLAVVEQYFPEYLLHTV